MARAELLFDSRCALGEGPLWHPGRSELFWFDIERATLFAGDVSTGATRTWSFPDAVSVAGIVDDDRLLIGSAAGLMVFDIAAGSHHPYVDLERERAGNRSNDGRVHPSGTFWVSTMARDATEGAGAIYAARRGRAVSLFTALTIPNAICFSGDGARGYFVDTETNRMMSVTLSPDTGMPVAAPEVFRDTADLPGVPDGAVTDAEDCLWVAMHGGGCAVRLSADGMLLETVDVPTEKVTCPALAGDALDLLVLTTAGGDEDASAGGVYALRVETAGRPEPAVVL